MAIAYKEISSNKRRTVILIFLFLLFIIGLGWIFSYAFDMYWIFPLAIAFASFQAITSYWYSDRITLAISRAKEVGHDDNKELFHVVENLCITAGLPMPRIYIIEDSAPNAFATGRDPEHAVVCVTTGLLDKLERSELEGVIAHELSHIGNYDIRLMTVIVVLVGIVALISDWFLRISFWGGGDDNNDRGQFGAILMIAGIVLAILSPIIAVIIQMALSRSREYLADSDAVLLTRYPDGLASALEKISADREPLEAANKATAHLYITNPLKEHKGTSRGWFSGLFETHPPIEERIRKLREM
ncbi:zinc metalloprotease HtpX [candidate division WS5 bacterium]|uniref:Protease HtpX homolog n=1 Tax=candidate division WS5 bacterium TaxID=2093353 RepID=A0A419DAF8_9BACT|nr:MAG: zinc metalloprotease HtpX [candidate division WS5 bacterium]